MSLFDDLAGMDDATELTIGDKTFKLGDLKGEYTNERTQREALAKERDTLRTSYNDLDSSVRTLLGAAGRAAEGGGGDNPPAPVDHRAAIRDSLKEILGPEDPTNALFEDKLFGRAFKTVEERMAERLTALQTKQDESLKAVQDMVNKGFQSLAGAQVVERENRWYGENRSEIPKGQNGKKITLEQMRQFCDNNAIYIPNTQLRDFDRALDTLTAPARRQTEIEAAREEGRRLGQQEARTNGAKVIPLITERGAGGMPKGDYNTTGKSARQIVSERIGQGLQDLSVEEG